jgi:hypothetical protein
LKRRRQFVGDHLKSIGVATSYQQQEISREQVKVRETRI